MLTHLRKFAFSARKDYYQILGLPRNASDQEIKEAYLSKAKQFHPDVRSGPLPEQTQNDQFQQVAEAYAVLSIQESKISYDLLNQEHSENVYMSKRDQYVRSMNERGVDGQRKKEEIVNEYEKEKRYILQEERKRFNVDAFGRYKGGVPQKDKGPARGNAWGNPSQLHDPELHNFKNNPTPDYQFVTKEDALAFKHHQQGLGTCFEIYARRQNRHIIHTLKQMAQNKDKIKYVQGQHIVRADSGVISIAK